VSEKLDKNWTKYVQLPQLLYVCIFSCIYPSAIPFKLLYPGARTI